MVRSLNAPAGSGKSSYVAVGSVSKSPPKYNVFKVPGYVKQQHYLTTSNGLPKLDRGLITSGVNHTFRPYQRGLTVEMHLIGMRALIADQVLFSELLPSLVTQVVHGAGELVRDTAMTEHPWENDTGATEASMANDPTVSFPGNDIVADMGPSTYYAPFLEFGWSQGGNFKIYPFMIPAHQYHEIDFINGCIDAVGIALGERPYVMRPPLGNDPKVTSTISRARAFMYSSSKALGDVQAFTGWSQLGTIRAGQLLIAKELGDLNAIMKGAVGTRISTRLTGYVTGRGLGYTRTVYGDRSYSVLPGGGDGNVGARAYNRIAGRATRPVAVGRFP
jgi:hypothetical protein